MNDLDERGKVTLCDVFFVGLLEISPVEVGVVSLYGVNSGLFVAMNGKGKLYGSVSNTNLFCTFEYKFIREIYQVIIREKLKFIRREL